MESLTRGTGGVDLAVMALSTWEARRRHLSWCTMGMSTASEAHTGLWSESKTSMHALYAPDRTRISSGLPPCKEGACIGIQALSTSLQRCMLHDTACARPC